MKVRNIDGTSENICKCGSWLEHWKNFGGRVLPSYCVESSCYNKPEVGAHVQKETPSDNSWYIVPLCKEHNKKAASLSIGDSTVLVSANISETCAKIWRYQ